MKGGGNGDGNGERVGERWFEDELDARGFEGGLPPNLSFHLSVKEAALVLHLRTLSPVYNSSSSNSNVNVAGSAGGNGANTPTPTTTTSKDTPPSLSIRQRLGLAEKLPRHDESGEVFTLTPNWHGSHSHHPEASKPGEELSAPATGNANTGGLSGWWQQIQRSTSPAPPVSRSATPIPPTAPQPLTAPEATNKGAAGAVAGTDIRVKVREKIRVESQDPALMAVMAKLSALGHRVEGRRGCLAALMGGA